MPEDKFIQGVVAALDLVAIYDQGTLFREIVESVGKERTLAEIKLNGLGRTKKLAKAEFNL